MRYHHDLVILEVRHLELVSATHREGSLTRAARTLHLTQSALSHQLRNLELQLGTELFIRAGKRLVMTPAGRRLLDASTVVLAEMRDAEASVSNLVRGDAGTLRITTECSTCYHWLPPVLRAFRERRPGVEIVIESAWTANPVRALIQGEVDVAVISRKERAPVRTFELFRDEMVAVMSSDSPLARLKKLHPRHFSEATLLGYQSLEESDVFRRVLRPAGVRPKGWIRASLTEAILELARSGLGVGVMASWAIPESATGDGSLIVRRIAGGGLARTWYAAIRNGGQPDWIEEFARLLQSILRARAAHESASSGS